LILADTQSKAPLSLLPIKVNRDFAHGPNHRALQSASLYSILSLGRIGFHVSFLESVDLVAKYGFEGLDPDANYFGSTSTWVLPASNGSHVPGKFPPAHTDDSGRAIQGCVAGQAHRSGLRRHGCRHEKIFQPDASINISPGEPDLPSAPVLSRIDI
jgi:hypothetical protein